MPKKVLIGISGGIAAYKSIELIRLLQKKGYDTQVILTKSALQFVTKLTLQTISRNEVLDDLFDLTAENNIGHIELALTADYLIIAPATANIIAKLAYGFADDMLSTVFLTTRAKKIIAPAMNNQMWENQITQKNVALLLEQGVHIVMPEKGELACQTYGVGRLASTDKIANILTIINTTNKLTGVKCLVTLGATIQPIDQFRYLTNYSSGKMGYYIIEQLLHHDASITAIKAKLTSELQLSPNIQQFEAITTNEMSIKFQELAPFQDIIIMVAAISDYQTTIATEKIKTEHLTISFSKSPDIIKNFGKIKPANVISVAFAAETHLNELELKRKFTEKNLDLLVVNQIDAENKGFAVDYNQVQLIGQNFNIQLPLLHKRDVAKAIVAKIIEIKGIDNQ